MTADENYLTLLSIFHYVVGGLAAVFALFPAIYLAIGLALVFAPQSINPPNHPPPPAFVGWLLVAFGGLFSTIGWVFAGFVIAAGRCLAKRRRYMFCLAIGCVECIFWPFGTVLGVFTIIVLVRESVKQVFGASDARQVKADVPDN